jgi:hypothetical protein
MIKGLLTRLGRKMTDFPMKPSLAKVLIAAVDIGCSEGCSHQDQTRQGHSSRCGYLELTGKLALIRGARHLLATSSDWNLGVWFSRLARLCPNNSR